MILTEAETTIEVFCTVTGGSAGADVVMMVGDEDITNMFTITHQNAYTQGSHENAAIPTTTTILTAEGMYGWKTLYAFYFWSFCYKAG